MNTSSDVRFESRLGVEFLFGSKKEEESSFRCPVAYGFDGLELKNGGENRNIGAG